MAFVVSSKGIFFFHHQIIACTLGRSGIVDNKIEGDGTTPRGIWYPRAVFYRSGRTTRPRTCLPVYTIKQNDGWCDSGTDPEYNKFVKHPFRTSAEHLWRNDALYDVFIVISHNLQPIKAFSGSAVFIHQKHPDLSPTAGCIGLEKKVLQNLIPCLTEKTPLFFGLSPLISYKKKI